MRNFIEEQNRLMRKDPVNIQDFLMKDAFILHRAPNMIRKFFRFFFTHLLYFTLGIFAFPIVLTYESYPMLKNMSFVPFDLQTFQAHMT